MLALAVRHFSAQRSGLTPAPYELSDRQNSVSIYGSALTDADQQQRRAANEANSTFVQT